jgi:hypothetical protein
LFNFQNSLRLIQSIPSKKAEPFKLWLASLGQAEIYRQQGYDENWIEQRMKSKLARHDITNEWKNRGIEQPFDFAILTNIVAKATFDKDIKQHKEIKSLDEKDNLRDNMTDLELMFSALGERAAKEITKKRKAQGLDECQVTANEGGSISGRARKDLEKSLGESIVTSKNRKNLINNKQKRQKSLV